MSSRIQIGAPIAAVDSRAKAIELIGYWAPISPDEEN